jgi:carboxymethylenebutenolidase
MTDQRDLAVSAGETVRPTQEMFDLYDQYCHSQIDRRTFMDRLGRLAVGGVTAAMLAEALLPKYASALQLREDDARIAGSRITYDSPDGAGKHGKQMGAYLVRPAKPKAAKLPAIVVVHENRGLNPHIADVARRAAAAGLEESRGTPLEGFEQEGDINEHSSLRLILVEII